MWFEYFGVYEKFTSCTSQTDVSTYTGTVGVVQRTSYNDSACTVELQPPAPFSVACSEPPAGEPILIESYLSQCSSTCAYSSSSSSSSSSDSGQLNTLIGLSSTILVLLVVWMALGLYHMATSNHSRRPLRDSESSSAL